MNNIFFLLFLLLLSPAISFSYEDRNHEVEALIAIREALNDPHGVLSNWDENSVDPCSWYMITCSSDNLVTALGAPRQDLSGTLSFMIGNLTNLKQVLFQNNNISGHIPKELVKLPNLHTLDLSNNKFSGHVPESLGHLVNLKYLRLNNNSLTGSIPLSLTRVPQLSFLDLSFNNLSGPVPEFPTRSFSVAGNPLICGSHSTEICSGSVNPIPLSLSVNPSGKPKARRVAIVVGFSLSFVVLCILAVGYMAWQSCRRKKQYVLDLNVFQAECEVTLGNLRKFTFKELQLATNNFSSKNILGSGGFGNVYKGKLSDGMMVAVKRLKDINESAGEEQFRTELELISLAVHRNLLRLIGYCATSIERLLVYPYMSNGSVASRLRGTSPLDWITRKRIAIGAARGLLYLHEQCDPKIIHRDVKAANILLDDCYEAIVGDFGLAKLLDHTESHITTAVRGTVGHIAPEYLSTGQSSDKTDIFGFGILLLELVTGMKAIEFGKNVHQKGAMLDWVKNIQQEKKIERLVDKGLGYNYDQIDAGEIVQVALLCTQYLPINRPKMSEVVCMLEGDGLAEKWAASHNTSYNHHSSHKVQSLQNPVMGYDDSEHHLTLSDAMTMDEDYDTHAMELSGPR